MTAATTDPCAKHTFSPRALAAPSVSTARGVLIRPRVSSRPSPAFDRRFVVAVEPQGPHQAQPTTVSVQQQPCARHYTVPTYLPCESEKPYRQRMKPERLRRIRASSTVLYCTVLYCTLWCRTVLQHTVLATYHQLIKPTAQSRMVGGLCFCPSSARPSAHPSGS